MSTTPLRHPAVAGRFYPADPDDLRAEARVYLSQATSANQAPLQALGCIAPHAGYMYSGHVAGAVFARVEVPKRCIVLCPNHTGLGHALAVMSTGAWQTPLGDVPIDAGLAIALKQRLPALQEDSAAHRAEHAAEVELPFLLLRQPELAFVPIALGTRRFDILEELGRVVAGDRGEVIARDRAAFVVARPLQLEEGDGLRRLPLPRAPVGLSHDDVEPGRRNGGAHHRKAAGAVIAYDDDDRAAPDAPYLDVNHRVAAPLDDGGVFLDRRPTVCASVRRRH